MTAHSVPGPVFHRCCGGCGEEFMEYDPKVVLPELNLTYCVECFDARRKIYPNLGWGK